MTTENEQITPADAAIVSSGTGTKGPEERDLPASLKEEMDLCLQILREVLGEFDENLLAKFDEVREHALKASDERFSGILTDTNPDQDDLQKVVDIIDQTDVHEAQLLARAFTTYFHLANLCEENYRVSVLHSHEAAVDDAQAVDPVNEMTCAYHQLINEMGPARPRSCSTSSSSIRCSPRIRPKPAVRPWKARSAVSPSCSKRISCSAARTRRKTPVVSSTRSMPCSAPLRSR